MPPPKSLLSYEDVRNLMDRALDSERGIRIPLGTKGEAMYLRQRCNKFRALDRKKSTEIYAEGDPMFGNSVYDVLILRVKEENLEIAKGGAMDLTVEEL